MKYILLILLLGSLSAKAQIKCNRINCNDSVSYTTTSDSLNAQLTFAPTSIIWNIKSGSGVIANPGSLNTIVTGLKPGGTTTITFIAVGSGQVYSAVETITVMAAPPPVIRQRVAIKIDLITKQVIYDDGSTTSF